MARDLKVKVRFEGDASSLTRETKRADTAISSLAASAGSSIAGLATGALAGVVGISALSNALEGAVKAAAEQEDAINRLHAALAPLGPAAGSVADALIHQAEALQNTTRFADDAIEEGQALLGSFTKNADVITVATQAAVDFAAAMKIDLRTAFLLVGKAISGETGALSRYGIAIDDNIPKAEKFAAVVAQINERFGGRAAADVETFSGALAQLGNAFNELQEAVGQNVTQSSAFVGAIEGITIAVRTLTPLAAHLGDVFVAAFRSVSPFLTAAVDLANALGLIEPAAAAAATALGDLGLKANEAATGTAQLSESERLFVEALVRMKTGADGAAIGIDGLTDSQRRLQQIQAATAASADVFSAALARIGVQLEADVQRKIAANNALLEEARARLDKTKISFQDFARIEAAVGAENAKLAGSFVQVGEAATVITGAFVENTEVMRENAAENRLLQSEYRRTGQAARAAAQSVSFFNAVAGIQARDARNQGLVDDALAAGMTPVLGGTRIHLPGGGSRLVGTRSLIGGN